MEKVRKAQAVKAKEAQLRQQARAHAEKAAAETERAKAALKRAQAADARRAEAEARLKAAEDAQARAAQEDMVRDKSCHRTCHCASVIAGTLSGSLLSMHTHAFLSSSKLCKNNLVDSLKIQQTASRPQLRNLQHLGFHLHMLSGFALGRHDNAEH